MKSKIVKHVIVYVIAALVIIGLLFGTQFYVKQRQKEQAKIQKETAAQTKAEAETRLAKVKVVDILPVPFTDMLVLPGSVVAHQEINQLCRSLNLCCQSIGQHTFYSSVHPV